MSKKNKNRPYTGTIAQVENTVVENPVEETTVEEVVEDTVDVKEEVESTEPVAEESDVEYIDANELTDVEELPEEVVNEETPVEEVEEETVEEPVVDEITEEATLASPEPPIEEAPSEDAVDDSDKFFLMIGNGKELSQAELIDVENKVGESGLQYEYTVTALGIPLIGPYDTAEIAAEKRLEVVRKGIMCKVVNKSEVE